MHALVGKVLIVGKVLTLSSHASMCTFCGLFRLIFETLNPQALRLVEVLPTVSWEPFSLVEMTYRFDICTIMLLASRFVSADSGLDFCGECTTGLEQGLCGCFVLAMPHAIETVG